jgi:hypothetical protein
VNCNDQIERIRKGILNASKYRGRSDECYILFNLPIPCVINEDLHLTTFYHRAKTFSKDELLKILDDSDGSVHEFRTMDLYVCKVNFSTYQFKSMGKFQKHFHRIFALEQL